MERKLKTNQELADEYGLDVNGKKFAAVMHMAYDRGHHAGEEEVEIYFHSLVTLVLVEEDNTFYSMSGTAQEVAKGMIGRCINNEQCMGMDNGFISFDPDVKYPWRIELERFADTL